MLYKLEHKGVEVSVDDVIDGGGTHGDLDVGEENKYRVNVLCNFDLILMNFRF